MLIWLTALAYAADATPRYVPTVAMTAADEYAIGREYSTTRAWLTGHWENAEQRARVDRILRRLVAASDRPDLIVNVTLLDTPSINASAYPGGFILVNRGTLELLKDDELAYVLGHELSHAILRHGVNGMNLQAATRQMTLMKGSKASNDRATAQRQADELRLMTAAFTRAQEYEADMFGMLYSVRAGFPAEASPRALQALSDSVGGDLPPEMTAASDHPSFADRITQLRRGAENFEAVVRNFEAGVSMMRAGRPNAASAAFQQFLTLFPKSNAGWANLAASYLAQLPPDSPWMDVLPLHSESGQKVRAAGDPLLRDKARDAIVKALEIDPYDPVALGLAGVLARREGRLDEARTLLERALFLSPGAVPLLVDLGNVDAQAGEWKDAVGRWDEAIELAPGQAEPYVNKALLLEQEGKKKQAKAAWQAVAALPGWERLAAQHLGEKPPASAAPQAERIEVGGKTLTLRMSVADATAALGPMDDNQSYADEMVYLGWWDACIDALVQGDRVVEWSAYDCAQVKTGKGISIGTRADALITAYGPPTDTFEIGSIRALRWSATGLVVTTSMDEVTEITLTVPE